MIIYNTHVFMSPLDVIPPKIRVLSLLARKDSQTMKQTRQTLLPTESLTSSMCANPWSVPLPIISRHNTGKEGDVDFEVMHHCRLEGQQ